jgi:hypothetical protein
MLIQVNRDIQFLGHARAQCPRQLHALLHGGGSERNKWAHIGGAHARVLSAVSRHVDQLRSARDTPERGVHRTIQLRHKGHHGAVGVTPGVDIQQVDAVALRNCRHDGIDDGLVASFTEIGNTLDELHHSTPVTREIECLIVAKSRPAGQTNSGRGVIRTTSGSRGAAQC